MFTVYLTNVAISNENIYIIENIYSKTARYYFKCC